MLNGRHRRGTVRRPGSEYQANAARKVLGRGHGSAQVTVVHGIEGSAEEANQR